MQETFPQDLKIVYKQHPLPNHYWALIASEAAFAAGDQGRFTEMDELIFGQQRQIGALLTKKATSMGKAATDARSEEVQREVFIDLAAQLDLDQGRFRADLESRAYLSRIKAETDEAVRVGATGTPASFVNGRFVSGARPFEAFRAEVQKELDWAKNNNRPEFTTGTNVRQLRASQPNRPSGPDPNKVYDLAVNGAPADGPAGAKVTILHYVDYQ